MTFAGPSTLTAGPQPAWLTAQGRSAPGHAPAARASLRQATAAAHAVNGDAGLALDLATELGGSVPRPGSGKTLDLWETLASLAVADLTAARVVEAHLDALAILEQASVSPASLVDDNGSESVIGARATWGVFAAGGAGMRLAATHAGQGENAGWRLDGTKPWCSLASSLSHALVTAHTSDTTRRLFAVDLRDAGITVHTDAWVGRGLTGVPSGPVDFTSVPATPVGDDGWYLTRPGFAWGGIGVAACWWGGAVGLARKVWDTTRAREPDQIALAHLGALDLALTAAGTALAQAAASIDAGDAVGEAGALLADRVRGQVARAVDEVILRTGHALGPAPLALDARHAQRVADLQLYVRQHHAERDDAALGRRLLATGVTPW